MQTHFVTTFSRKIYKIYKTGFYPKPGYVGFVVDEVALGQAFFEYFGFPCQFSFHKLLHIR
jgi:hypothetical protein